MILQVDPAGMVTVMPVAMVIGPADIAFLSVEIV